MISSLCLDHAPGGLSVCLYLSVCLSVCVSVCLSVCLSVSLSVCLSAPLPFSLSLAPSLSLPLALCLSVCLTVCPSLFSFSLSLARSLALQGALETTLLSQHRDSTATREQVRDQLQLLLQVAPEWCSQTSDPILGTPIFCVNPHAPTGPIRVRLRELAATGLHHTATDCTDPC